jgi:hypothetical protein
MSERKQRLPKGAAYEYRQIGKSPFALPLEATASTGDGADLPYYVTIDIENRSGVPECTRLVLERRPDGPPVTTEGLRKIPVGKLIEWAAYTNMVKLDDPEKGISGGFTPFQEITFDEDTPAHEIAAQADEVVAAIKRDQRSQRRRITDDDLRQLADVCRRADAFGSSYIRLAELEMGLTHDQARQWKRKAIDAGFYTAPTGDSR